MKMKDTAAYAASRGHCGNGTQPKEGYAFVIYQEVNRFYDYESGLLAGTVFPELVIPQGRYGPNEIIK